MVRRNDPYRLYEILTDRKTIEPELLAFYHMVEELRSEYKFNDSITNVGHVIASQLPYQNLGEKSIKLVVHPELNTLKKNIESTRDGSIEGYGVPIVFTCDSKYFI